MVIITIMALTCVANAQLDNEFGPDAGNGTLTGDYNSANGYAALTNNTSGIDNSAYGADTLYSNTNGSDNTAYGAAALYSNTSGNGNTANGAAALVSNTTGTGNTALGKEALPYNATGNGNIAIGNEAGFNLTNGDSNIYIGNAGVADESGTIRIGTTGTHTNTFIAGISGVTVPNAASPVVVDSVSGQLGTVDIGSLVGPKGDKGDTGDTGAQGPVGPQGAIGPQGADGTNGVNGIGFVPGAYLYLPATATAPDGFTRIGTKTDLITDLRGHMKTLKMNVYQKN